MRIYRQGDRGPEILDIQQRLAALGEGFPADEPGRFGPGTADAVRAFQDQRGLQVDGLVGPDTWGQLVEASFYLGDRTLYLHAPHMRGDDVRVLQRKLNALGFDAGREDGVFGPTTDRAVREFQRNVGEEPDGVVGMHTIETIDRMRPIEGAPSRAVVREGEELRTMTAGLEGHVIAIDRADAPGPHATIAIEAMIGSLGEAGARPTVLQSVGVTPSERAKEANDAAAAICVSWREARSEGASCAYFGSASTHSPAGELLARAIAEALGGGALRRVVRLRTLTVAMLRETRMPAVVLEFGELSGDDEARTIGEAVSDGVRRFYGERRD